MRAQGQGMFEVMFKTLVDAFKVHLSLPIIVASVLCSKYEDELTRQVYDACMYL